MLHDVAVYAVFEVVLAPDAPADVVARYAEYRAAVPRLIDRHGGSYLARAAPGESLEGEPTAGRWHLVEFPNAEAAHAFWNSPEYADLQPLRHGAADVRAILIDPETQPA